MKKVLLIVLLLPAMAFAQRSEDNTITVKLNDTAKIYERVRQAIAYTDLIIRGDANRSTLITPSERIYGTSIFTVAKVEINGDQVKITGGYGLGLEDFWGFPAWPKSYKRISYFKGSEAWLVLRRIAIKL